MEETPWQVCLCPFEKGYGHALEEGEQGDGMENREKKEGFGKEEIGFGTLLLICSCYLEAARMGLSWAEAQLFKPLQEREVVRAH